MNKDQLRKSTIGKLKKMSIDNRKVITRQLIEHLLGSKLWKEAKVIGLTVSQHLEWDTKPIIKAAWEQQKKVCVPKCTPQEKKLHFYEITSYDQLETVYYNLLEPDPDQTTFINKNSINLLIVPGLIFDKKGYRIGFGGGYYDRFLTDFSNKTVSLSSETQLVETIPAEHYDIPVQHIITEHGLFK